MLGSLLLVGFHIVILCSLKHLKKSAFCIPMSMDQINDVHYSGITGILVITICKSTNKKKPSLLFGYLCPCPQIVPSDADADIAAYAMDPTSNALRSTVQQSVHFK
jgi:hypothetical protein